VCKRRSGRKRETVSHTDRAGGREEVGEREREKKYLLLRRADTLREKKRKKGKRKKKVPAVAACGHSTVTTSR
jgi:hypothetical protein